VSPTESFPVITFVHNNNKASMASLAASNNLVSGAKLTNPVAVFVGGTSGIGQGMAEAFNRHMKGNCHIVIVGRNYDAAESIISTMKSVAGESRYAVSIMFLNSVQQICSYLLLDL